MAQVALLGVVALALALYLPRLGDYFVSDDFDLLHWAERTSLLDGLVRPPWQTWFRPVTDLLWQITEAAFGRGPAWHHLVNLGLHLGNACLVGVLASRAAGSRLAGAAGVTAAAVFAVHPTTSAAVQWLSGRYDLLSTSLSLLALVLATRAMDTRRRACLFASVACAVLALLAKEAAAGLPPVALVLASATLARTSPRGVPMAPRTVAWSLAALLPLYLLARWAMFGGLGGYGGHGRLALVQIWNPLVSLPLATFPWPVDSPLDGASAIPWLGVAVVTAGWLAWRAPLFACAYLASFAPVLNMMGQGGFVTAEVARLMYFPAAMVAAGIGLAAHATARRMPWATVLAASAFVLVAAGGTWERLQAWRDAAAITARVQDTLDRERVHVPSPVLVDFRQLPDNVRGAWVYRTGYDAQVQMTLGERTARGTRPGDAQWALRDGVASLWCLAPDGASLERGLCAPR